MKRFLSIFTALLMVFACCVAVAAEEPVGVDNLENISYTEKSVTGASSGKTAKVHIIEFNPADYVPFAYSGNGGSVCLTKDHVDAAIAEGYDVVGAINGSFFEMSTGSPCGTLITDGKLVFTHFGLKNDPVVTFDAEGNCKVVSSTITTALRFKGSAVPAGIALVNKNYGAISALKISGGENKFQYYDMDAGSIADEAVKGFEVVCEKDPTTELIINKALKGKVLEIKPNSYYGATKVTEKNQFVLFLKAGSTSEKKVTDLAVGDSVEVTVKETGNKTSIAAMESAISAIGSGYWLVKDGRNVAAKATQIGSHSTTLCRAWTAFGTKEDGTYVFWTSSEVDSEGENAVTLRDVAEEMAAMGCVNVIRLDGGGSTSMFVSGEDMVMFTTRKVCDALLIVDKDTLKYNELVADDNGDSETSENTPVDPDCTEPAVESSEPAENEGETDDGGDNGKNKFPIIPVAIGGGVVLVLAVVAVAVVIVIKKKK